MTLQRIDDFLAPIVVQPAPEIKRGRPLTGSAPMTGSERVRKSRGVANVARMENIAVLDMETDPFDKDNPNEKIYPFLAILYSNNFSPIIIWEENYERFVEQVLDAINSLPEAYTIYAHNGGKFDYMFFIHKLRGKVSFKGRGIMSAKIGIHELRDSYHIIPEKLANLKKDEFDYKNMRRDRRNKFKTQIIEYCLHDCEGLLEFLIAFIQQFGMKISIGQAAMAELKKHYTVKKVGGNTDAFLRNYFFGGRVECLQGRGHWASGSKPGAGFKLYDVNSMYPYAMAEFQHPIGNQYQPRRGAPNKNTVFVDLQCRNFGALVARDEEGNTTTQIREGRFRTTIWEFETALQYGLIDRVKINWSIDIEERSDFSAFVLPTYAKRQETKTALQYLTEGSQAHSDIKKDDIFLKLLLNNAYGKFAQNPRKFKEHFFTDVGARPPEEPKPKTFEEWDDEKQARWIASREWAAMPVRCETHYIWSRPAPLSYYNNVGTAASITGAARSILMRAIHHATDAIYCDTDSLICRELRGVEFSNTALGAWKLEKELDEIIINGKKLYAYKVKGFADGQKGRDKIRSKGTAGLSWADMMELLKGASIPMTNFAPTLTRDGRQHYLIREIRATAGMIEKMSRGGHEFYRQNSSAKILPLTLGKRVAA